MGYIEYISQSQCITANNSGWPLIVAGRVVFYGMQEQHFGQRGMVLPYSTYLMQYTKKHIQYLKQFQCVVRIYEVYADSILGS